MSSKIVNNIDLSGIKRFSKTLRQIRRNTESSDKNQKYEKFGTIAHEILSRNYVGTSFKVSEPQLSEKGLTIYAAGYGIAFDEFGTGAYAQNTYKGKLPTQTITFETKGLGGMPITMSTSGWEYYYDNPFTKSMVNGRLGWWTLKGNTYFSEGQSASNRFYNSCQEIKKKIKEDSK